MDALPDPRAAAHERLPLAVAALREQQQLEPPAARPAAAHAGRDDARIVQHEQVAGAEQPRQRRTVLVRERLGLASDHEQPRRRALGRRLLGDQLGRQRVVEVVQPHVRRRFRLPGSVASRSGRRRSIGTGKMVVELFSVAISARVCR